MTGSRSAVDRRNAGLAALGLLGTFGYWAYTAFWSGEVVLQADWQATLPDAQPAVLASLPDSAPREYWAGPLELDAAANPFRIILEVTVRRGREIVDYRLALADADGTVVWEEHDTIQHTVSQQDKQRANQNDPREKRIRQPSGVVAIERSGRYTLLAAIDRVEAPAVTVRSRVAEASPLVYGGFGGLAAFGVAGLLRSARRPRETTPGSGTA